jgi:hypothetical protein
MHKKTKNKVLKDRVIWVYQIPPLLDLIWSRARKRKGKDNRL